MAPRSRRALLQAAIALWIVLAGSGVAALTVYAARPGAASAAFDWPAAARVARPDRPTLVMALHPECACSRASLAELARLQAKTAGAFDIVLLVATHAGGAPLESTPIGRAAMAIPGARVVEDPGGADAARFGAKTSGHVVLFDAHGVALFRGGLTASRGHEGDSDGAEAIRAIAQHLAPHTSQTPVYGCSIAERAEGPQDDPRR